MIVATTVPCVVCGTEVEVVNANATGIRWQWIRRYPEARIARIIHADITCPTCGTEFVLLNENDPDVRRMIDEAYKATSADEATSAE